MKDLHLQADMNPVVALLYATVSDTYERLKQYVAHATQEEIDYKGPDGDLNSIGQLLRHLAVVDLHWVYRLKHEDVPLQLQQKYGPMIGEDGKLPPVANISLEQLLQEYGEVQTMFYLQCKKLTEAELKREVFYEKGESATIRWGIWHIADHSRYHQAHIGWMRKLYKERVNKLQNI
ncbi:hypothetical protein BAMA_20555 [Bacillus manliponensis]|uniref:DinB-like domain-containing protein n=1 Tax=Bacillus manliponensis TaxID=574376 RepID=A0A073JZG7_9BACI|nr:DinB family protein [Bacillus manliponensis]KEK19655.1 hypothetical protein BAMA_20555 [Bacillus manliponensis]